MPPPKSAVPVHRCVLKFLSLVISLFAVTGFGNPGEVQAQTIAAGDLVFSQVYTRGGNPGSTYKNNFIELFNRSNAPVDFSGKPLHIASDTGGFNFSVSFVSSRGLIIPPGGYLLIAFETAGSSGDPLPFFDLFVPRNPNFPIELSPSGKLAITNSGTSLNSPCPAANAGVIDYLGYGSTANCFEGTGPIATLSNTTAAIRNAAGCTDTNNNAGDFTVGTPNPRNSFSPRHLCSANQIDEAEFFVRQHYADFLNRQPDAPGLAFWTNQITSCGTNQSCIDLKRINVSAAFFLSGEFQETGYLVYRTYKTAYGNLAGKPVPLTRAEFTPDAQMVGQGVVVGAPGWEQQLENNKVAFFIDFVSRLRFRNAYPTTLTPPEFVNALFATAAVTPTAAERSAAINQFGPATDTTDTAARARALRLIAENPTLGQQEKNRAFVLMQYFGYLQRNPNDAPEPGLNFGGYNFWLGKLDQFNGNYIAAEMVKAFVTSSEYRQRFAP